MLQINYIRDNKDEVIRRLAVKNFKGVEIIGQLLALDERRRETQKRLDDSLAESNAIAREIGSLFQQGKASEAGALKEKTAQLKTLSKEYGVQMDEIMSQMDKLLVLIPNLPHDQVRPGHSAEDNEMGILLVNKKKILPGKSGS